MISSKVAFKIGDEAFINAILGTAAERERPILVGLCGPQGSGKSTTASRLHERLVRVGKQAVVLSLDDFYLTRAERMALAESIHPLLVTRGVPGTHDIVLLVKALEALQAGAPGATIRVPTFDKLSDDRKPHGVDVPARADVVILEGWCIGARPQPSTLLPEPINQLEARHDTNGTWRTYINDQLATVYRSLFDRIDLRLMLKAPSFEIIPQWRLEQEQGLATAGLSHGRAMGRHEILHFVRHYERVTRQLLLDEPADMVADIDDRRVPRAIRMKTGQEAA